jgi:GNAT superfamily N-acetyltransferase
VIVDISHEWPIRAAGSNEIDALAQLWFDGWQDAHAEILPAKLKRMRTLASFRKRLSEALGDTRTAGPEGTPWGLAITKDDELHQLYVGPSARGTGLAARLTSDALSRIASKGYPRAWLACAIGNERAARFYEKVGWHRERVMTSQLPTEDGMFPLDVWRYEIELPVL